MSPPKLFQDQYDEFAGRARALSDAGLALAFGLSESSARRWRLRLGVCRPAPSVRYWGCGEAGGTALPPERYEEFKRLAATWSNVKLSAHFRCARGTVRRYREKFGVPSLFPTTAPTPRPRQVGGDAVALPTFGVREAPSGATARSLGCRRCSRPRLRRPGRERLVVTRWRCWRCDRLVIDATCPGCGGSFGKRGSA